MIKYSKNNKSDNKIKLFDENFVKKNKDNYYLIINNKKINLCEYYLKNNKNKTKDLKVILIKKNNNVIDMSKMFYECSSLSSLYGISKWNINNVTDMS